MNQHTSQPKSKTWTREDLKTATDPTLTALAKVSENVHSAALAYARYHDQTAESDLDRQAVHDKLDLLIDSLTPEDIWAARQVEGIEVMRGLVLYKRERDAGKRLNTLQDAKDEAGPER